MQADILIVSNGPGELSSWVRPVVRQFRRAFPQGRLTVALVPCPYASGEEADTVRAWDEAVAVWEPRTTMRYLLLGQAPQGFRPSARGAVIFLGGDQLFGALLARRTGYPLLTYTDQAARWRGLTRRFLLSDRNTLLALRDRGYPADQLRLVGNLMVDAVQAPADPLQIRKLLGLRPDQLVLGLLPGSKPFKVRHVTPLFLRVAEILQARHPDLQVVLHRSPFTPREQLSEAIESEAFARVTGGARGRLEREGTVDWIVTERGARVLVVPPDMQYAGMGVIDLALTVPGTNTAELAVLGVPMVVALPLHRPEEIPVDGLVGQLGGLPGIGRWLKRFLARQVAERQPLVALPNQRAGSRVTPELIGSFAPEELTDVVETLVADPIGRREVKLALHQVMGAPGAGCAVVDATLELLRLPPASRLEDAPAPREP